MSLLELASPWQKTPLWPESPVSGTQGLRSVLQQRKQHKGGQSRAGVPLYSQKQANEGLWGWPTCWDQSKQHGGSRVHAGGGQERRFCSLQLRQLLLSHPGGGVAIAPILERSECAFLEGYQLCGVPATGAHAHVRSSSEGHLLCSDLAVGQALHAMDSARADGADGVLLESVQACFYL